MIRDSGELGSLLFRFATISDTHVNPSEDRCNSPFPVNARANRRFRHVVADLRQRDIAFVLHLGDLVHPVPDTGALYREAAQAYRDIASGLNVPIHHVPGNHDIGDTPIKGAPAAPTTQEMIAAWVTEFGPQYHAFSHQGIRFILLNAQLINSELLEETQQRTWLESELSGTDERVMVILHHPPYLCAPDEPGHYDNTDPPGRGWLLDLLQQYGVEAMFAGHAHNFWYDRYHETDYYLAPATSFVRQDYCEMLRAPPPNQSEYGRDDKAKLGYFIVNVYENGHTVQVVRTDGAELRPEDPAIPVQAISPTPLENKRPLIGFDLRQNWAELTEVPPSGGLDEFDRKLVRNDYALLALIEMGVRDVRIPLADLRDPVRRARLRALCHLGLRPTLFSFGLGSEADLNLIAGCCDLLADWEITIDWQNLAALTERIGAAHRRTGLPVYLSRMRSKADLPEDSVYFHVINHGFSPQDQSQIDILSELQSAGIVGAVFRLGSQVQVRGALRKIDTLVRSKGLKASIHLRLAGENPAVTETVEAIACARVSEALDISLSHSRIFCDTLVDVDRGYFPRLGAIDRKNNPRALARTIQAAHTGS